MRHDRGLEASPRCAVYWKWKRGVTKVELDDAKAPAGATGSTTSCFAARVLDANTPPAPYYRDADADGIGDACEAPVVSDPVLTDPALTGASV